MKKSNKCKNTPEETIKYLFKGYRTMTGSLQTQLSKLGIVTEKRKKHWILKCNGYIFSCPSSSSDHRAGLNLAQEIIRIL